MDKLAAHIAQRHHYQHDQRKTSLTEPPAGNHHAKSCWPGQNLKLRSAQAKVAYAARTGSIPTNVVLSKQVQAALQYNPRSKTVSFSRAPRAFLVLDANTRQSDLGS
jgi:hypothetical protein